MFFGKGIKREVLVSAPTVKSLELLLPSLNQEEAAEPENQWFCGSIRKLRSQSIMPPHPERHAQPERRISSQDLLSRSHSSHKQGGIFRWYFLASYQKLNERETFLRGCILIGGERMCSHLTWAFLLGPHCGFIVRVQEISLLDPGRGRGHFTTKKHKRTCP